MFQYNTINETDCVFTEGQERMRRDLRYHFMNPKEKWQAKGTLPIKMILIVVKVMLITIQVIVFSQNNSNQVIFVEGSKTSFKHLFLNEWSSGFETLPYPPTSGKFAIYKSQNFFKSLDYALTNYYNLEKEAIGPYSFCLYDKPLMNLCIQQYKIGNIYPSNSTYLFLSDVITNCTIIKPIEVNSTTEFNVEAYLKSRNFTINFDGLITATVSFCLKSIQLKSFEVDEIPDCFQFNLSITFDNSFHNGQIIVDLHTDMIELNCMSKPLIKMETGFIIRNSLFALDSFILLLSMVSLILCCRSIISLFLFWKKVKCFFLVEMGVDISNKRSYFWNISYFIIFIGDVFILTGTIVKLEMYSRLQRGLNSFMVCNYFLGLGLFFGYLTLLRYFSYFPKSSILVNTIRVAIPPLLRFSLCSIILYMAFALLGWIILGPYHLKFRTFESSIACLFSLMMGDEIYVTLSIIQKENIHIYLFSQLFVYFFLILFIFVVLNLILTIIIEAYDNVKNYDSTAYQIDSFWSFINSCPDTSKSPLYRSDKMHEKSKNIIRHSKIARKCVDLFCCCIGQENHLTEIQGFQDKHISEEELSSSFCRNEAQQRLYSVVTNDYRSFCVTNRFASIEPSLMPINERIHRVSL